MIYNTIEEEIVPKYYDRDADGIPRAWMASVKKCIAEIASNFTTNRMLRDYEVRFYNRLAAASGNCRRTTSPLRARSSPGSTRCWLRGLP